MHSSKAQKEFIAKGFGVDEKESWYQQSGQGMLASIKIAEEKKGVILTDRGTYIKYEANESRIIPAFLNSNPSSKFVTIYNIFPIFFPIFFFFKNISFFSKN